LLSLTRDGRFRAAPPKNFDDVYGRAISQRYVSCPSRPVQAPKLIHPRLRFYVLDRTRSGTDGSPEELVELAGSTGNVYHVRIAKQPTCDCPHAQKGHQCKHWLYVMSRVLRAKFEHVYQLALLDTELREIFANAPPPPDGAAADCSKHRKAVEGDCPICFDEMDANAEAVVWCKAACGQNIHKECFETWAATKRRANVGAAAAVTCPYCRSVWKGDEDSLKNIKKTGNTNFEGYVNVASQLGIDTVRGRPFSPRRAGDDSADRFQDTSTYHSSWRYWANRRGRPS